MNDVFGRSGLNLGFEVSWVKIVHARLWFKCCIASNKSWFSWNSPSLSKVQNAFILWGIFSLFLSLATPLKRNGNVRIKLPRGNARIAEIGGKRPPFMSSSAAREIWAAQQSPSPGAGFQTSFLNLWLTYNINILILCAVKLVCNPNLFAFSLPFQVSSIQTPRTNGQQIWTKKLYNPSLKIK